MHRRVAELVRAGKVLSAHDVSDGGLAAAIAEMCIAGECGASLDVAERVFAHCVFANVATTYLLEMAERDAKASGLPIIGQVESPPRLRIARHGGVAIDLPISELAHAWREPLAVGGGT